MTSGGHSGRRPSKWKPKHGARIPIRPPRPIPGPRRLAPRTPDEGDPALQSLVVECLAALETGGAQGVDAVLARHPERASAVRERIDALARLGLLGESGEPLPERIAGYRILGVLGRGGMGIVYEAEQESPRRRVALKVLRQGAGSTARFRHEAELLARLQHPCIAQVFEVGSADMGGMALPFFAMELVRGRPIDRFAAERDLGLRERLELLARLCEAVQHAHQAGVIHRDLKPANVLVDERGAPCVLDFGLARAIDPNLELATHGTLSGQLLGTLAYMSPEQAAGDSRAVGARSDVYALGVIAYEVLTGHRPHDTSSSTVLEALRALRDDDPPLLGELDRAYRGDLETIVAKALEKDRGRRYASAQELGADLLRFLAHQPIAARPPSAGYRVSRFARRHRALVVGLSAVFLALAGGLAGTLYGLLQARERQAEAEGRLEQAEAVLAFQRRMLSSADPGSHGREARVLDVLASAALELQGAFTGQPEVEAAVRRAVGETYAGLGLWAEAEQHLARASQLYGQELGPDDPQALAARTALGALYGRSLGRTAEGESLLTEVVARGTLALGGGHAVVLQARLERVSVLNELARFDEAAALASEVATAAEQAGHAELALEAQRSLAWALGRTGRYVEAVEAARAALAGHVERHGGEHPRTLKARETLGVILQNAGQVAESGALIEEVLETRRTLLGEDHPDTLRTMANLVAHYLVVRRLDAAEELGRETIAACERKLGERHAQTLLAMNNLSAVLQGSGKLDEAIQVMERTIAVSTELKGAEHTDTLRSVASLAKMLQRTPRFEEAEPLLVEALASARRALGERHPDTLGICAQLGSLCDALGRNEEAALLYAEALEGLRAVLMANDPQLGVVLVWAGNNLRDLGRYEEAEVHLLEGLACFEHGLEAGHELTRYALQGLTDLNRAWGRPAEAARYAERLASE